jgi:hypothetical protein
VKYSVSVNPDRSSSTAHQAENRVTERYSIDRPAKAEDSNWRKLKAIVRLFGLTPTQVARATGVSRPYVSRLLNENDRFTGSSTFYRELESRIGVLIDNRSSQVFDLIGAQSDGIEMILRD